MSRASATHVSKCGKYIYREVRKGRLDILNTGIEFYCDYKRKWMPSIMIKRELIELSKVF